MPSATSSPLTSDLVDPASLELRQAVARGVEAYAYACQVEPGRVEIVHNLPVLLA